MCAHTSYELIGEIVTKKEGEVFELYTCKECGRTLAKNGKKKPVLAEPRMFN